MAGQTGYAARNQYELGWVASNCGGSGSLFSGPAGQNVDVLATAPYFGGSVPLAWTADADGGLAKFFTEQNKGGILPSAVVTGNCGNGIGKICGGPTAYTLASGLSVPSAPQNGSCVGFTLNQPFSTSGATLSVDGGAAYLLSDWLGTPLSRSNYIGSGYIGETLMACFTNATSAGSVTAQWHLLPNLGYAGTSGNGWLAQAINFWKADKKVASDYNIGLVAYESGQTYVSHNSAAYEAWYYAAMRDSRMGECVHCVLHVTT